MRLKGTEKDIRTISRELGVQYALEGSVRKAGNNLRITAQLIDAVNDTHLWSNKYSGTLDDVFEIQEKVSRSIVNALKLKLNPEEDRRIAERPIDNLQAYECYLRARREMLRLTDGGLERALRDLQNGLEIVGENVLLLVGMGEVYAYFYETGVKADEATLRKAEEYAHRVLKLQPESSYSHYLLGKIERLRGSVLKAIRHFEKALAIEPDAPDTLFWLGIAYALQAGRASAAQPLVKRMVEIDPLTSMSYLGLGLVTWMDGQLHQALAFFEKHASLEPESIIPEFWSVLVLAWMKRYDEAFELTDRIAQRESRDMMHRSFTELLLFFKHSFEGNKKEALGALSEDVKSFVWNDPELSWIGVEGYALMDEKSEAIRWLERAIDHGWINYPLFNERDPFLENIRGEKQFKKLMERVKYEWEHFDVR